MAATLNRDTRHKKSRTLQVTFDLTSGTFTFDVDRAKSITLQTTGDFSGGTLTANRSNDGATFAALGTAIAHTSATLSTLAAGDLGWKHYRLTLAGATAAAIVATIHINE